MPERLHACDAQYGPVLKTAGSCGCGVEFKEEEMTELVPVLISLAVFLLVLLVCREIACWYIKTTEISETLKEIRDLLKKG
jgi:hypothetical protein